MDVYSSLQKCLETTKPIVPIRISEEPGKVLISIYPPDGKIEFAVKPNEPTSKIRLMEQSERPPWLVSRKNNNYTVWGKSQVIPEDWPKWVLRRALLVSSMLYSVSLHDGPKEWVAPGIEYKTQRVGKTCTVRHKATMDLSKLQITNTYVQYDNPLLYMNRFAETISDWKEIRTIPEVTDIKAVSAYHRIEKHKLLTAKYMTDKGMQVEDLDILSPLIKSGDCTYNAWDKKIELKPISLEQLSKYQEILKDLDSVWQSETDLKVGETEEVEVEVDLE